MIESESNGSELTIEARAAQIAEVATRMESLLATLDALGLSMAAIHLSMATELARAAVSDPRI